jgi:hypothetical protein
MNAEDFKKGLEKLRRDCDQRVQEASDAERRRHDATLELIFSVIRRAADAGQGYAVLGERFGLLDEPVLRTLQQSGCIVQPLHTRAAFTRDNKLTGYRIVWNQKKKNVQML